MTDIPTQFSDALAERAASAAELVGAIRLSERRHLTASIWRDDLIVASEQSLPERETYDVVLPGGVAAKATLVGRDTGTNIALLKLDRSVKATTLAAGEPQLGSLVLAFGADGADGAAGATVRLGIVNHAGPQWHSRGGGKIDRRIVLDVSLARSEEGGPVLDTNGARLGFSTFGRRQVIVIPSATVERVIAALLQHGHIARGWLGVALQPVAVPDALQAAAGQKAGLMVMSVADGGPSAAAGILAGDILLSIDGEPMRRYRRIAGGLGPDSIGREVDLKLIRSGAIESRKLRIAERPRA